MNGLTLWRDGQGRVTGGSEHLASFAKTEKSHRYFCRLCGGQVMARHPQHGIFDVSAATIRDRPFAPMPHVYYAETVLRIPVGLPKYRLPKYRELPAQFGGSGKTIAE